MTSIGIIGAGHIGSQLARMAVAAGHEVLLANTRGPASLQDLVAELGGKALAVSVEDAARNANLVIVSIPVNGYETLPVNVFNGKTVIDTGNYYPEFFGHIAELDEGLTSPELLQRLLRGSRVVKAFSHLAVADLASLAKPGDESGRVALLLAGDDAVAKAEVARLINEFGFDYVDAGDLAEGWRFERNQPATGAHLASSEMKKALQQASR